MHQDISDLRDEFLKVAADVKALTAGLTPEQGVWRAAPGSWNISECLDHLAIFNQIYLQAMEESAFAAKSQGKLRRGPAQPGLISRLLIKTLEPPVRSFSKTGSPPKVQPRVSLKLADTVPLFLESQDQIQMFLAKYEELDLTGVSFNNPFIRGVQFRLATGLHALAAHERRHVWQAWNVRKSMGLGGA